jgi:hypothetical protein
MSKPRRKQALVIAGLMAALCLPVALKALKASANTGHDASGAPRQALPAQPSAMARAVSSSASVSPGNGLTSSNPDASSGPTVGAAPLTGTALAAVAPQPSPTPSPTPVVQMLKVWMYGGYFYPRTIYARPGQTLILVRNESQTDVTLVLLPYGASSSSAMTVGTQNQTNSSAGGAPAIVATGVVNLSVGQYIYYDQTNPAFQGVIVVQANQ